MVAAPFAPMSTPGSPSAQAGVFSKPLITPSSPIEKAQAWPLWRLGMGLQLLLSVVTILMTRMGREPVCARLLVPM